MRKALILTLIICMFSLTLGGCSRWERDEPGLIQSYQ